MTTRRAKAVYRKAGKASAQALTPEQRAERARKAAAARWNPDAGGVAPLSAAPECGLRLYLADGRTLWYPDLDWDLAYAVLSVNAHAVAEWYGRHQPNYPGARKYQATGPKTFWMVVLRLAQD